MNMQIAKALLCPDEDYAESQQRGHPNIDPQHVLLLSFGHWLSLPRDIENSAWHRPSTDWQ